MLKSSEGPIFDYVGRGACHGPGSEPPLLDFQLSTAYPPCAIDPNDMYEAKKALQLFYVLLPFQGFVYNNAQEFSEEFLESMEILSVFGETAGSSLVSIFGSVEFNMNSFKHSELLFLLRNICGYIQVYALFRFFICVLCV